MKRVGILVGALMAITHCPAVQACASVADGAEPVRVTDESAIIIWDAGRGVEHFIRRATFDSAARSIGFLVPTPSVPQMAPADEAAFSRLESLLRPKVVTHVRRGLHFGFWLGLSGSSTLEDSPTASAGPKMASAPTGGVTVLQQQRVGKYDAAVLAADDVRQLGRWLARHHYPSNAALRAWLEPYVKQHWKITAFKIANHNPASTEFSSEAVRLSFATKQPFFPYREPANQRVKGAYASRRSLRIFFLGEKRVEGRLEDRQPWRPGTTVWTDALPAERAALAPLVALNTNGLPVTMRLTVFEDYSSPRPGFADIAFSRSAGQGTIVPPPIVNEVDNRLFIPFELVLLFICGAVWFAVSVRTRHLAD